jgi:hypothetical protein
VPETDLAEYDTFDYKHFDETPLSLEEAVKKATQLRAADRDHMHRVVSVDSNMSGFRIESIPTETIIKEKLTRWHLLWSKFLLKPTKR